MPKQNRAPSYLVTGANRGIGLAFARALVRRGDRVIATARRPDDSNDLAKLRVRIEPLDVADEKSLVRLAGRLRGEPLDVLINNAAIGDDGPALEHLSMKDLERAFRINSIGPIAVAQALLPNLRAGSRRTVVSLSSGLGSISGNTGGGWIAYGSLEGGVELLDARNGGRADEGPLCLHCDLSRMGSDGHGRPRRSPLPRSQRRRHAPSHRPSDPLGLRAFRQPPRQGCPLVTPFPPAPLTNFLETES